MTADLRFALLGPVRAWRGDAELDLGAPQQRSVLAALLLAEGRQVPIGTLIDGLWPANPPRTAAGTVRTYVSRLRRVLAPATGDGTGPEAGSGTGPDGLIKSAGDGYLLVRGPARLDLDTFEWLTGKARATHADPGQAARLLREALDLWQGEPLAGLPGRFAASQRDRLAELRMAVVEEWLALDIELGRHIAAAAELPGLLAADPLRERLTELLMLALYRSGRQADALAAFDATRRRLADDLGIDPGPALRDLHQRILRMDSSLVAPVPAPRVPAHQRPAHQLTAPSVSRPRRQRSGLRWCDSGTERAAARRPSPATVAASPSIRC